MTRAVFQQFLWLYDMLGRPVETTCCCDPYFAILNQKRYLAFHDREAIHG